MPIPPPLHPLYSLDSSNHPLFQDDPLKFQASNSRSDQPTPAHITTFLKLRTLTVLPSTIPQSLGKKLAASFFQASPQQKETILKGVTKSIENFEDFLQNLDQTAQRSLADFLLSNPATTCRIISGSANQPSSYLKYAKPFFEFIFFGPLDSETKTQLTVASTNALVEDPSLFHQLATKHSEQWNLLSMMEIAERHQAEEKGTEPQCFTQMRKAFFSSPSLSWMALMRSVSIFNSFISKANAHNQGEAFRQSFCEHLSVQTKYETSPTSLLLVWIPRLEAALDWVSTWPKKEQHTFIEALQKALEGNDNTREQFLACPALTEKTKQLILEKEFFHKYSIDKVSFLREDIEAFNRTKKGQEHRVDYDTSFK